MIIVYPFNFGGFVADQPKNRGGDEIIPDEYVAGYVRGYRWWRIVNDGGSLVLTSLHAPHVWGSEITAECLSMSGRISHDGKSPHPDCACGIYAQRPDYVLQEWERRTRGVVAASGSVAMHGRILVCKKGFKAEHAIIESPVLVDAHCELGCDERPLWVEMVKGWTPYAAYCGRHAPEGMWVRVDVDMWLRHVVAELSARYENVEFISPSLLEEIE